MRSAPLEIANRVAPRFFHIAKPVFPANFSVRVCHIPPQAGGDFATMDPARQYAVLPARAVTNQQSIQCLNQHHRFRWLLQNIDLAQPVTLLRSRQTIEVLVWARMVVKQHEFFECRLQQVMKVQPVKMSWLTVRMRHGLPCRPMARHR